MSRNALLTAELMPVQSLVTAPLPLVTTAQSEALSLAKVRPQRVPWQPAAPWLALLSRQVSPASLALVLRPCLLAAIRLVEPLLPVSMRLYPPHVVTTRRSRMPMRVALSWNALLRAVPMPVQGLVTAPLPLVTMARSEVLSLA